MDGARRQYNGTLQMVPHLNLVGRVRKHPNWKIWEFSLKRNAREKKTGCGYLIGRVIFHSKRVFIKMANSEGLL